MGIKDIRVNGSARGKLVAGVDTLASAVAVTFGPRGRHVMFSLPTDVPVASRDGLSVAREIALACKFESVGARLVVDAASKAGESVGDGTTTTILLAQAIVRTAHSQLVAGFDPSGIKRGVDLAIKTVLRDIEQQARPSASKEDLARVATTSAGGDRHVGELIATAIEKVGPRGVITVEPHHGLATELEVVEGLQFASGYLSPSFISEQNRQRSVLKDAAVLIYDKVISTGRQMLSLLEAAAKSKRPLLIIAEDVVGDALSTLAVNNVRGTLRVCAVRAPEVNDRRHDLLQDIAAITGTIVVSPDAGMTIEGVVFEQLGRAARIEVSASKTILVGGRGNPEQIKVRIGQIEQRIAAKVSEYDVTVLEDRLGKLRGGAAVIRVGGATEVEQNASRSRIEDAVNATRAAAEEGVVPGGGVALIRAAQGLRALEGSTVDETAGIHVVRRALEEPLRRLATNAGADPSLVVGTVSAGEGDFGYDAEAGVFANLMALGIVDPLAVTRTALRSAGATAGLMLTNEAVIVDAPKRIRIHHHDARVCGCGCGDRR